jgi:hypothetical protein
MTYMDMDFNAYVWSLTEVLFHALAYKKLRRPSEEGRATQLFLISSKSPNSRPLYNKRKALFMSK